LEGRGGKGADPEANLIYVLLLKNVYFENHVKISKTTRSGVQGKLKLTKKDKKFIYIFVILRFFSIPMYQCGPGSIVGIAIGYGLDGSGIESRWGRDFLHLSRSALGPTQPPVQRVPCLPRGVKSGRATTLTPHTLLVPWS